MDLLLPRRVRSRRLLPAALTALVIAAVPPFAVFGAHAAADGELTLIEAARNADRAAVRALVAAGSDVNRAEADGATALHWASYRDDLDSVDLLLRSGARVDAANDLGATPLWLASQNGSAAVVERLLQAGAAVFAPQRRPGPGRSGLTITAGVDLADEAAVAAYYGKLPPLWASVHLAGGYAGAAIGETTAATARAQMEMNFFTSLLCCREAVGQIRKAGAGGRLLNVTSKAALAPGPGSAAYAASKAAVSSLTQVLAAELRDEGIWANAVAPSTIDTAANRSAMPAADRARWAAPADIADAILWLISPANTTVTGAIIPVYGRG